ncbi:MAG: AAA family ATPase [Bacteroidota bacterium]
MIIIINGALGVGKTSVAETIHRKFEKSVHLDGDHIGNVNPFEIYDNNRIKYLYNTLALLVEFHKRNGYPNIVINYVFESPESLNGLISLLVPYDKEIHTYWLTCEKEQQQKRIQGRTRDSIGWELNRFIELQNIQRKASMFGFIGKEIDTTMKSIEAIAEIIWKDIHS